MAQTATQTARDVVCVVRECTKRVGAPERITVSARSAPSARRVRMRRRSARATATPGALHVAARVALKSMRQRPARKVPIVSVRAVRRAARGCTNPVHARRGLTESVPTVLIAHRRSMKRGRAQHLATACALRVLRVRLDHT